MRLATGLGALALTLTLQAPFATAKDRGCDNRILALYEAQKSFDYALQKKEGVNEARAQFMRAREKAAEEGCLAGTQWDPATTTGGRQFDPSDPYRERDGRSNLGPGRNDRGRSREDRRIEELIETGYRRGLSREEFSELEELRRRVGR